jgi:predicted DNA binding CopG/RHH family protein
MVRGGFGHHVLPEFEWDEGNEEKSMSDEDRFEKLLESDWGDEWENLPAAPPLVPAERKSAQLTLRLPADLVISLKEVASRKALAYHALARSWIADGLRNRRTPTASEETADFGTPDDVQLNLKLSPSLLAELKAFSHQVRQPYHRLARLWLRRALSQELETMAASTSSRRPSD